MHHPSLDPQFNYTALKNLLAQCAAYLEWPAERLLEVRPAVSGWSIGHHLHHLALAHGGIPRLLERLHSGRMGEEGAAGEPRMQQLIYDGIIPRGWESPSRTAPPDDLTYELVVTDFNRMRTACLRIESILADLAQVTRTFPHPFLGPLTSLEWVRFMHIHCRHHLGIVREVEWVEN